jgi:hypothetical protein
MRIALVRRMDSLPNLQSSIEAGQIGFDSSPLRLVPPSATPRQPLVAR